MFVYTFCQEIKDSSERILENLIKKVFTKEEITVESVKVLILTIVALNVFFISSIIASLFLEVSVGEFFSVVQSITVLKAVQITLSSIFLSVIITVVIGVPTAYLLAREEGSIYRAIDIIISIPLILPPAVSGLALLMTFGRKGVIGRILVAMGGDYPFYLYSTYTRSDVCYVSNLCSITKKWI